MLHGHGFDRISSTFEVWCEFTAVKMKTSATV